MSIFLANLAKDRQILVRGDVADEDLVADAAQEGFVRQAVGVQIGGEDDELIEGHPELLAGVEAAEVLAGFQGIHPAVEELPGGHLLAAEIVDDEDAVIGPHLVGRLIEFQNRVEPEFQGVFGHFAADDDHRPPAQHPAGIVPGRLAVGGYRLMVDFIEEADDLAVDVEGEGNVNRVLEGLADGGGHDRLAVARRAEQEDGAAAVDGRADLFQEAGVHFELGKHLLEAGHLHLDLVDGLRTPPSPSSLPGEPGPGPHTGWSPGLARPGLCPARSGRNTSPWTCRPLVDKTSRGLTKMRFCFLR